MAGCYDRTWRVGSKARGTRSQFRLNTDGLLPFRCPFPVHLTDAMDAGVSAQSDLRSPARVTRTRAVREYEQTIEDLKKENFDLKLRIFLLEEDLNRNFLKNRGPGSEDQDHAVQVTVNLRNETEALRNELSNKDQLLQGALDQAEKYASDLKELQDKFVQLQEQLSSCVQVSSEQEIRLLKDENENLLRGIDELQTGISAKENEITAANAQVEELCSKNKALQEKHNKSRIAIQGLVYKYYQDTEKVPKDFRQIVETAVQAAKEKREDALVASIENFRTLLYQILRNSGSEQFQKEVLPAEAKTSAELLQNVANISGSLEELCNSEQSQSKSKFVHDTGEHSRNSSRNLSRSSESIAVSEQLNKSDSRGENLEQMMDVLRENESLKEDNDEKSKAIQNLNATCSELEERSSQLQKELFDAVSKIKILEQKIKNEKSKRVSSLPKSNSSVQTAVQWHLLQSKISDKFLQNAGYSNNIDELKQEILMLMLVIEQKDKEILDIEEKYSSLQSQLESIQNKKEDNFSDMEESNIVEKKDLHQRLALSCSVNNELMKHLKNLEAFMEDLLQNKKIDSRSLENIYNTSDFLSQLTSCLDRTLQLSSVLNDHLSICEGSRIFVQDDASTSKDESERQSFGNQSASQLKLSFNVSSLEDPTGKNIQHLTSLQQGNFGGISAGTGKRRLSFSTLHKSTADPALLDSEKVVVLGTSNNEDLILLLNDKGDPEDVLIRNNHSHLDKNSTNGDQHRRRCWESSVLGGEKSSIGHHMEWYAPELVNPKMVGAWYNQCPSSDSDIWSEPDRDVSLQRIGIDVQKSPVTQKSPRRSRYRDKCSTDEFGSQKNESSSSFTKLHFWSKRKKSSEPSRSSFICKKCMSQSQPSDDLSKDEKVKTSILQRAISELTDKCTNQDTQLQEVKELLKNKGSEIEALNEEKLELSNHINDLKEELLDVKKENNILMQERVGSKEILNKENHENDQLRKRIDDLESEFAHSDSFCRQLQKELGGTKMRLKELTSKCADYEEKLSINTKAEERLKEEKNRLLVEIEKLKEEKLSMDAEVEERFAESLKGAEEEKDRLLEEIKNLNFQKESLLHDIQIARERNQNLEDLNQELSEKLEKSSNDILSMQASRKELADLNGALLHEKKECENNLLSSNSMCDELRNDLIKMEGSLRKLDSKCVTYEKELKESKEVEERTVNSLWSAKDKIASNLRALNDSCKQYLGNDWEGIEDNDNLLSSAQTERHNSDKIDHLFEAIVLVSDKFEQTINLLSEQLRCVQSKLQKSKTADEEYKLNLDSMQQELKENKTQIQSLETNNSLLKVEISKLVQNLQESEALNVDYKSKITSAQQHLDGARNEIMSLKKSKDEWQTLVEQFERALSDKEKSLSEANLKNSSQTQQSDTMEREIDKLKFQLSLKNAEITKLVEQFQRTQSDKEKSLEEAILKNSAQQQLTDAVEREIEQYRFQISLKDDEITKLQEKIFNLQTHLNSVLTQKVSSTSQTISSNSKNIPSDKPSSSEHDSLSTFNASINSDTPTGSENNDTTTNVGKDKDLLKIDRYRKKVKALQAKLSMTEKRIEILEKEKNDIREDLLAQVGGNEEKDRTLIEVQEEKLKDLGAKLETKTSFIKDLKTELYKTCNSVVDKQREINDLNAELFEIKKINELRNETKTKDAHDSLNRHSDPLQVFAEENIKELKKHKWELIQSILRQEKQFYERKNIHLGHFEKFKNHIESWKSLQISPPLFKSESEPLLNAPMVPGTSYAEKCDRILKNSQIELELDVQCLQNIKNFLKRFFVPLALQPKNDDSTAGGKFPPAESGKSFSLLVKSASDDKYLRRERPNSLHFVRPSSSTEVMQTSGISPSDRFLTAISTVSHKIGSIEAALKSMKAVLENIEDPDSQIIETPKRTDARSLSGKIYNEVKTLQDKAVEVFHLNSVLKSLGLFEFAIPNSPSKHDLSDRESLLSEETITLSRSGSLSPMSFDENFLPKFSTGKLLPEDLNNSYQKNETTNKMSSYELSHKSNAIGGSQDSIFLRSHFSSPDLGIESDPNHESSAPEQTENFLQNSNKVLKRNEGAAKMKQRQMEKQQSSTYSLTNSSLKLQDNATVPNDTLHAIGYLQEYELLKKEVQESLVSIKAVLSRASDGLQHISKYTSPRKNLEYSTFKAIKDACGNIDVCLEEAARLIGNFWIAPCPTAHQLNSLIQQNEELLVQLKSLQESKSNEENSFKELLEKLKQSEARKEKFEREISKKLVKTKKVIRRAENKLLEKKESQHLPPIPKYPRDD